MFTAWILQMTLLYGTLKVSKLLAKKGFKKLQNDKKLKAEASTKYQAQVLDQSGQNIAPVQEFNKLDEVISWAQKYAKTEKPNVTISSQETHPDEAVVLEPTVVEELKQVDLKENLLIDKINEFELKNKINEAKVKVLEEDSITKLKGEVFTPEDLDKIDKDIVTFLYNNSVDEKLLDSHIEMNLKLNQEIDENLKNLSKKVGFKTKKQTNFFGDKNDKEKYLGYLQQSIHNKSALINYVNSQKGFKDESILPADFLNQPIYFNNQQIDIKIKSAKALKNFDMNIAREKFHETKTVRKMDINELKVWRKDNNDLIEATVGYITKAKKYNSKDLALYVSKAKKFTDALKKSKTKAEDKFKVSPEKAKLNTSLKKNVEVINDNNVSNKRGLSH